VTLKTKARLLWSVAAVVTVCVIVQHAIGKSTQVLPPSSEVTLGVSTECVGNMSSQLVLVSISKRHMWVCENAKQVYDSAVVTGMQQLAADLTPQGTYHVYAKETNTVLAGSDSTGKWSDRVSYWLPFLENQYGTYGFHDATWRPNTDFGNINPNSSKGSHGCVELPLATAKWLYNWMRVGTTVTIKP
jgi:lipoprotein-anchoring transpeptidase ErfK/SrfK